MLKQKQSLGHEELYTSFQKGMRNGNWRKRNYLDKALYRASLWYAKRGRRVENGKLIGMLLGLVTRLKETKGMRIFKFKRGFERAAGMLRKGGENFEGVFVWAPRVKDWLKDPDYIFWLGWGGEVEMKEGQTRGADTDLHRFTQILRGIDSRIFLVFLHVTCEDLFMMKK